MGNESFCKNDTRDNRMSTVISTDQQIPIVRGSFDFTTQKTFKKIEQAAIKFCQQRNINQQYIHLVARIIAYRHDNLFEAYRRLPSPQQHNFLNELTYIDIQLMDSLYYNFVSSTPEAQKLPSKPPSKAIASLSKEDLKRHTELGMRILQSESVGIVIMCGGSSSRCQGHNKFLLPLQTPSKKSILQLMFQRLKQNLAVKSQLSIPILIVCNEVNRYTLEKFIKSHEYFGLSSSKFRFVLSKNLPILDSDGKFCLSFEYKILTKPAGTAQAAEALLSEAIFNFMKKEGVKYVHFCGTENLSQNPADPLLLGIMINEKRLACGKCVMARFQTQNFNRYVVDSKGVRLIDVDTLTSFSKSKLLEDSPIAMNSLLFDLEQLKRIVADFSNNIFLSKKYHLSEVSVDYFDFKHEKPLLNAKCFTFEKNICDILSCYENPLLVVYPRKEFIPLVSKVDEYSIKSASTKLMDQ